MGWSASAEKGIVSHLLETPNTREARLACGSTTPRGVGRLGGGGTTRQLQVGRPENRPATPPRNLETKTSSAGRWAGANCNDLTQAGGMSIPQSRQHGVSGGASASPTTPFTLSQREEVDETLEEDWLPKELVEEMMAMQRAGDDERARGAFGMLQVLNGRSSAPAVLLQRVQTSGSCDWELHSTCGVPDDAPQPCTGFIGCLARRAGQRSAANAAFQLNMHMLGLAPQRLLP